jgi:hypothetical protein
VSDTLSVARKLQELPDNEFRAIVEPYAKARFKTKSGRDAFMALALERKNRLTEEFERFVVRLQPDARKEGLEFMRGSRVTPIPADKIKAIRQAGKLPKEMDDDEIEALRLYNGGIYEQLNARLRNNLTLSRITPQERRILAAANLLDGALDKLPKYEGEVHRGTNLTALALRAYKPGAVVTEQPFTSTSTDMRRAFKGNVLFTIRSKSGRLIEKLSLHEHEREVLFKSGTRFIVKDVQTVRGITQIEMEEMGDVSFDAIENLVVK